MALWIVLLGWMLVPIPACRAQLRPAGYRGPVQLGPYRTQPDNTRMRALYTLLGRPQHPPVAATVCYQSSNERVFLWIAFQAHSHGSKAGVVMLGTFPNCWNQPAQRTRVRLGGWRTEKNIGLGSPEAAVLRAYGAPSARWQDPQTLPMLNAGDAPRPRIQVIYTDLRYSGTDTVQAADFGIRHGRVAWIRLVNGE